MPARSVTATFARKNMLTIVRTGTGSGRIVAAGTVDCSAASCSVGFNPQDFVTLQVLPAFDSQFTGWSGACSGTGGCGLFMDQDRSVTATIMLKPRLSVTVNGSGSGTVTGASGIQCSESCSAVYDSGFVVTLSAAAGAGGSTFAGWCQARAPGQSAQCTITIDANKSVTATFNTPPSNTPPSNPGNEGGGGKGGGGSLLRTDLALLLLLLGLAGALRRQRS